MSRVTLRRMARRRPSMLVLVTGFLLVLLPTLAFLQHRWVTQVSDARQIEMGRDLRIASFQYRDALGGEIVRAIIALRAEATILREGDDRRYADRYALWRSSTRHPGIVANVYLLDLDGGTLGLQRWNERLQGLERVAWSDALAAWRPHLERAAREGTVAGSLAYATASADPSLVVAAVIGQSRSPEPDPELLGFTIVELDLAYIQQKLIPTTIERTFSQSNVPYRVTMTDGNVPPKVLYASEPGSPFDLEQGFDLALLHPALRDPLVHFPRWTLLVQFRTGSAEAALATLRRRNIGISMTILALLTASVVLLSLTSRRAQHLARQQIEFVAGVSHELRTPVAVIRTAAENLSHGVVGSDPRVVRYGRLIETEARRLGNMVEGVLQYAGLETRHGLATREPVAPVDIVDSAVAATERAVGELAVQCDVPPNLPYVIGDFEALRSAVQNLIANAVKYGGENGEILVRASRSAAERLEVCITVEDHGPGIPAADVPYIFEPFYRGANARSSQTTGSGLGLALVKQIVAAHGGRVTVTTRPGSGSAFTLHLPAEEAPDDARIGVEEPASPVVPTA